jgi:AraC family L-rhamnose operon transcriptional activator RhaR/AraC family L-rhamnose operon regulatory protein RhaS
MSISTANRLFNKLLHETPIKYLIRLRINHAVILLKQGDLSISDVAYRSGFQDSNYFSLQFKKITGVAPARFRKNNLNS